MPSDSRVHELLRLASPATSGNLVVPWAGLPRDLQHLLNLRNGFYVFESALHVRPAGGGSGSLEEWNRPDGWIASYAGMADGLFFFAEDVFGVQFAFHDGRMVTFDPETAEITEFCDSLDGWAGLVLDNFRVATGYPAAHEWQTRHGSLPSGCRLVARQPFVLGGSFEVDNLRAKEDELGMVERSRLALQLRGRQDGETISYVIEAE